MNVSDHGMTEIIILTTDMGNGGAFCGHCHHNLDNGDASVELPPVCPQCSYKFTGRKVSEYNFGGSDFDL